MKNRIISITTLIIGIAIIGVMGLKEPTAGDLLDKQITIENKIKKLNVELKEITAQKNKLYVDQINDGVSTGLIQETQQPQKSGITTQGLSGQFIK